MYSRIIQSKKYPVNVRAFSRNDGCAAGVLPNLPASDSFAELVWSRLVFYLDGLRPNSGEIVEGSRQLWLQEVDLLVHLLSELFVSPWAGAVFEESPGSKKKTGTS